MNLPASAACQLVPQAIILTCLNSRKSFGEEEHVARMAENRGHVGSDEVLSIAKTDDHRRPQARGDDFVRIALRDYGQGEDALQLFNSGADRILQVALKVLFHQMRDDLG